MNYSGTEGLAPSLGHLQEGNGIAMVATVKCGQCFVDVRAVGSLAEEVTFSRWFKADALG